MTDWVSHHRPASLGEPWGWLAAAVMASLLAGSTVALALWLDQRAGTGTAPDALLLDLPPLPSVTAQAESPPEAAARAPDAPPEPLADETPPSPATETVPDLSPPSGLAPVVSNGSDPPQADTPPARPRPKAAKSTAKPEKQTARARAAAAPPAAAAKGDGVDASAMQKWLNQSQKTLGRHMARKTYGGSGQVRVLFSVAPSGQITAANLQGSTGNASLDAAILAQARRAPALPPRPDGKAGRLALPVRLRG